MDTSSLAATDTTRLLEAIVELSQVRELEGVMRVVRERARQLTGADGVTFVLREGDRVFYADEDAIGPLWKGQRFPASACISGWAINRRATVVIEDIYDDARIPHEAYRPTFVKSLAMTPIRALDPVGAIGAYWARPHRATEREVTLIQSLAAASAVAIHNAELLADLRRAARVREEFLVIASHEMRTPLAALTLHVGSLQRTLRGDNTLDRARVLQGVDGIARGAGRLNDLIEHLLEATRVMNGHVVLTQTRFDLVATLHRLVDQSAAPARAAGCELRVEAPASLLVEGDEERLGVAITNLLSNAVKYGAHKPIDVTLEAIPIGARLSVLDRGIGIAAKDHSRIFDPFERAVSTQNYGGFGVGLWAARKMIEAHGGRIELSSEPGQGALFVVELRAKTQALEALH